MIEAEPQVTDLSGGDLQRVLSKLFFSVLRRADTKSTTAGADLTLAQLSILLTLLDQGPIRMTELAARERCAPQPPQWRSAGWKSSDWSSGRVTPPRTCGPFSSR